MEYWDKSFLGRWFYIFWSRLHSEHRDSNFRIRKQFFNEKIRKFKRKKKVKKWWIRFSVFFQKWDFKQSRFFPNGQKFQLSLKRQEHRSLLFFSKMRRVALKENKTEWTSVSSKSGISFLPFRKNELCFSYFKKYNWHFSERKKKKGICTCLSFGNRFFFSWVMGRISLISLANQLDFRSRYMQ